MGLERGDQVRVQLVEEHRQREDQREEQRDADRRRERLADPERDRLVALRRRGEPGDRVAQAGRDRAQRGAGRRARAAPGPLECADQRGELRRDRARLELVGVRRAERPVPGADLLLGLRRQRRVDEVQQFVVLPHADGERRDQHGERHDQPGAQLVEMLDDPQSLIVVRPLDRDRHHQPRRLAQRPASASLVGSACRRGAPAPER